MLTDSLPQIYLKVFLLQVAVAVALVLVLLPFNIGQSMSALAGSAAVLLGNAVYFFVAGLGGTKKRLGGQIFGRHLVAELLKIVVIALLLFLTLASGRFDPLWVVIAAVLVIVGHGFAFLIIR